MRPLFLISPNPLRNCYFLAPLAVLLLLAAPRLAHAQTGSVGIGTTAPDASAALDIVSTSKGLLLPRLTLAQRTALTNSATAPPVPGLVIYQTDNTPGLYAYDGAAWVRLGADNLGNHTATQNLDLGPNALVGNGGTSGLRVDAAGNALLPAANAYRYAAPKAYSVTYGAGDFQPETNATANGKLLYIAGSTDDFYASAANGVLRAPMHLPQGAVITSITLIYFDIVSTDITLTLRSITPSLTGGSTFTSLGSITPTGAPGYSNATLTPTSTVTIDNAKTYYLQTSFGASNSNLTTTAVRVNYTVTTTE